MSGFSIREQIEHMDEDVMRDVAARQVANGSRGFLPASPRHRTNRSISPVKSGGQARLSKSTGEGPCLRAGRLRALYGNAAMAYLRV